MLGKSSLRMRLPTTAVKTPRSARSWTTCAAMWLISRGAVRFACAAYRRSSNYIRVPTTVIGLIDASVSIKVAVNYGNYKNRLGAYHAPLHTFLDFTFLRTLPIAQVRNGFAELIKISSCAHLGTFDLLDKYCEDLIESKFGRADGASDKVRRAADSINRDGIHEMLRLETPNLHEIGLDRIIAYGHTCDLFSLVFHPLSPDPAADATSDGLPCTSWFRRRRSDTVMPSPSTWLTRPRWPTIAA